MAIAWISAAQALKMVETAFPTERAKTTIWGGAYGGQLKTRAESLIENEHPRPSSTVPMSFWQPLGVSDCSADWDTGHFMSLGGGCRWQAFGVQFAFDDILNLLPAESRPSATLNTSVMGNPEFISAVAARRLIYSEGGVSPGSAGRFIIDKCRLGLIAARAVQMNLSRGRSYSALDECRREWDVPTWFWKSFTAEDASSQDWALGKFAGRGSHDNKLLWIALSGVAFHKTGLSLFVPSLRRPATECVDENDQHKPRLSESDLQKWWRSKSKVRDSLTQEELLTLIRSAFPDNQISRERIRDLAGDRKRGPKGIGDKDIAK